MREMTGEDFVRLMHEQQERANRSPEEQRHDRLLEKKVFHYEVDLRDPDETVVGDRVHSGTDLLSVATEGEDAHAWEECGGSRAFPWHRVMEVRASWYIPDEVRQAFDEEDRRANPGQYL